MPGPHPVGRAGRPGNGSVFPAGEGVAQVCAVVADGLPQVRHGAAVVSQRGGVIGDRPSMVFHGFDVAVDHLSGLFRAGEQLLMVFAGGSDFVIYRQQGLHLGLRKQRGRLIRVGFRTLRQCLGRFAVRFRDFPSLPPWQGIQIGGRWSVPVDISHASSLPVLHKQGEHDTGSGLEPGTVGLQEHMLRLEWTLGGDPPEGKTIAADVADQGVRLPETVT